ncbi:MAG TPA: hypothetical protein VHA06_17865 [Candidatus Angelobacter sp.]|jgi:hypothetical protein|nr:hypothetical protein [Candidatus Angelobacter sp.]
MSVIEFPDRSTSYSVASSKPEDPDKLARLRLRAKTDLMWLANEVLGYDFQENPHRGLFNCYLHKDPAQKKTLTELDPVKKRRLILWPRGHFKTSAAAVEAVQLILNFPDIRIMILAGDLKESKVRLEEIKGHFENWGKNGKLQKLFPEFCSKVQGRRMGNSRVFISPARVRKNLRQPTLAVFSPKILKTGTHFDVAMIDDLVNELNSLKPEQLAKSIADYKSIVPVIDPEGFIYVSGTRYSHSDCYGYIQELIKEEGLSNWLVSLRTASITRCKQAGCNHADIRHLDGGGACSSSITQADGVEVPCGCQKFESSGIVEVLFPQAQTDHGTIGFTPEILEKLKIELGPEVYGCQYENNPLIAANQKFTREMLYSRIRPRHLIPSRGPIVIQVDLAVSQKKRADDMVLMVSRIRNGRHHIIDIIAGHIPPDQQPKVICDLIFKYGPRAVFIEKKTGAQYLERLIVIEAQERRLKHLPLQLVDADNSQGAKDARIGALLGYMRQDRILFLHGVANWEKLESQLLVWPKNQLHDDLADCLGLLLQAPTGFENDPLPPEPVPYWLREQQNHDSPLEHGGLPFGMIGMAA